MYLQKCSVKKAGLLKTILLIVAVVVCIVALYFVFSFINIGVSPTSATAAILLVAILLGYFVLKASLSDYEYETSADKLIIKQFAGKRLIKEFSLDKNKIESIEKDAGGMRLYPAGTVPYTITVEDKKYSFAPDETTLSFLQNNSFTDAYIDAKYTEMLNTLKELLKIPSVKESSLDGMPFGKPCADALKYTLDLCEKLGMKTKNLDNYCGWAEIGEGEKLIAILSHLDVVPAGDGWNSDPFCAKITDEEIFARGAIDDKGPAVAAIYAVSAIREKLDNIPCRIRLIFGCDEESGWGCMDRYSKTEDMPDMAFTPDGSYPVIITEKGIAHFNIQTSLEEGDYQLYMAGGLRPNMVPDKASATIVGNIDKLFDKLNAYDVHSKGLSFSAEGDTLLIDAVGIGAHGSTPEKGTNAFFELFKFLNYLDLKGSQGKFIDDMLKIFVDKTDGSGANLNISDEISGALSLNLGMCFIGKNKFYEEMNDDSCRIVIDIRYPASFTIKDVSLRLQSALPSTWECEIDHQQDPHHVDKESLLVKTLMSVYKDYTGRDDEPLAIGGGTYARTLPGKAVAFGVEFPGREDKAHQPNESFYLDDFKISAKMFAAAIEKLISD